MQGVITQKSYPKIKIACITALNKVPDTRVIDPSRPKILVIQSHLFRDFRRFLTTMDQSFSGAVRIHPRYLKYGTEFIGSLYALKSCSVLSRISSAAILCRFHYAPFVNYGVLGWRPFHCDL